jgi:hypothetical protein
MISQRRSLFYIVVAVLLATMTLAANTGAGPQKAMPPTPTKPMDQLTAQLQKLDPKAAIVRYVLYGDQPASRDPLHRCAWKPTLSYRHHLKEEQLRRRRAAGHATLECLRTIDDQRVPGCQREESPLP